MNSITLVATIVNCYVGCGSGSPDRQAIHVLECDTESGAAKLVQSIKGPQATTYFEPDASGKWLYSIASNERGPKLNSSAVRFPIVGGRLGEMERFAELPCTAPCHVALSTDGTKMIFAAYTAATAGVLPVNGGEVKSAILSNEGAGPNKRRQQKAFAHFAFYTPDARRIGVINLGCDRIHFFDAQTMTEDKALMIRMDPGDGPRHAIWAKDNRYLYVINELGSTVTAFSFDGKAFAKVGKWTMLPPECDSRTADGDSPASKASAIKFTADGKILMASNRGHESIAFYDVDTETGRLSLRNIAKLTGSFPRDFELMPGERFMIVGHEHSNEIQVYAFDRAACTLKAVGAPIVAWQPLCFKFK